MICNKCNHKLPDDSEFCQYCGNKIEQGFIISTEIVEKTEENTPVQESRKKEALLNNNDKKAKGKKVTLLQKASIGVSILLTLLIILFTINYSTASKNAENALAIYLSESDIDFLKFDQIYAKTDVSITGYTVEISGSVVCSINNGYKSINKPMSAKLKKSHFGKYKVTNVTVNGKKIKKD